MRKFAFSTLLLLTSLLTTLQAQNVIVSGAVTGNGPYPTLEAAFTAINIGVQTGATIVVSIVGNTSETATAILNQGTWQTLYIAPVGGAARTISGSIAGPLVEFNGADRVGIDGLNSGGNSLTIENTSIAATASTLHFINDARALGFQRLTLLGASASLTSGTVFLDTGAGSAGGNDSIAFSIVNISNSGANFPVNAVYSAGNVTSGQENSSIQFTTCNVSNFFSASLASRGIFANTGNSDWTIDGCKFFQTASRSYTTSNTHSAIRISSGNNHVVTSNTIGFASSAGTGTYTMTSSVATRFIAIELSVGSTTATSVQGNTVTAASLTTSSGASTTYGIFCGIAITAGNANVGNLSPNIIGGSTGVDLINVTPSTSGGSIVGINCGSTGTILVQNNIIGGCTSVGTTAGTGGGFTGISVSATAASLSITGNTIGNASVDNMRAGTFGITTGSSIASGISVTTMPTLLMVSNNTIRNLSSYGSGTTGYVRGFWTLASTTSPGTPTVSGNTLSNFTTNNTNASYSNGQVGTMGIGINAGANPVVSGNTIFGLRNINTGTTGHVVAGMALANATNCTFRNNIVYGLSNASTSASATVPGVVVGMVVRSGTTATFIYNNMISLGNGETTNTAFVGIMGNHGSTPDPIVNIYHNTINIEGTAASGAQPSFGIARTDFLATARTAPFDVRNNIVTNTRTGGTGLHYAIANNYGAAASTTGWGANASNNNILNAAAANIGHWTTARDFGNWKGASNSDIASFSNVLVVYVNSANDLHLNFGITANAVESNGQTIALVPTDIDGQNRPGPSGSINGGATAPDLGADEIDGVVGDFAAPVITYAPVGFTCSTADRIITATITDVAGVPTTGILQPRIYFRKNAGAWFSAQGVLTSGSGNNGTWDFTITSATLGGLVLADVVDFYIIAQDIATPTFNISSNPGGGLVATNVNTVSTPPSPLNSYAINGNLSGTFQVGLTGTYPTLTSAVAAYNNSCLTGPVSLSLIDATYPTETYPISINANPFSSSTNTLTIKPATGVSPAFIGAQPTALLIFSGADYVTLDGSNGNIVNSVCPKVQATRDLSFSNTDASTSSAVISLVTNAGGNAATNNKVINCNLNGNTNTTTAVGVNISGPTIGGGTGANGNNNNQIINNAIQRVTFGIFGGSAGAPKSANNTYNLNMMNASGTNAIGRMGMMLLNEDAPVVHGNTIGNIIFAGTNDVAGISIGYNAFSNTSTTGGEVTNASVMYNMIDNLVQNNTYSACGIAVASAATGTNLVANNFVSNVFANGTAGDFGVGILSGGGAAALQIYHNTVTVTGATLAGATQPNMGIGVNGTTPAVDIRNNIVVCTGDNGFAGNTGIGLGYSSTLGNYANLVSNNNDFYVSGTGSVVGRTGGLAAGVVRTTLLDWQTETGRDANSLTVMPNFTSANDLHMLVGANYGLSDNGAPLPSIINDIDCETRSATTPDIGADEWVAVCSTAIAGALLPGDSSSCSADSLLLSCPNFSEGAGSAYVWESSPLGLGTFTPTSGVNPLAYNTGLVSVPTEYRLKVTCGTNSSTAYSDTLSFFIGDSIAPVAACQSSIVSLDANGDGILAASSLDNGSSDNCTAANALQFIASQDSFSCADVGVVAVTLTVEDAEGNTSTCVSQVNVNAFPLSASVSATVFNNGTNVSCFGGTNGAATATVTGGCGPYTYSWSNAQTTAVISGLGAGSYTVTITDASAQADTQTVVLTEPSSAVSATATSTNESCVPGNDGTIDLTPAGGSPGYTFVWSNSATTEDLGGLAAGTYDVTVSDISGCNFNVTVTVSGSVAPATPVVTQALNVLTCTSTGVSYQWFLNGNAISGATNASYTTTQAGSYTVTITDANGCTATSTPTVIVGIDKGELENALQLWPNPARESCYVLLPGTDLRPCTLSIYDLNGRVMLKRTNVDMSAPVEISLQDFSSGFYLIETLQDGIRATRQLVVQ